MAEGEPLGLEPQAGSKTPASGTVSASFRREIRGLGGVEGGSLIEELDEEIALGWSASSPKSLEDTTWIPGEPSVCSSHA